MKDKGPCDKRTDGAPCHKSGSDEYFRNRTTGTVVHSYRCPAHSRLCNLATHEPMLLVPYDAPVPLTLVIADRPVTSETCPHGAEKCLRCTELLSTAEHRVKLAEAEASKFNHLYACEMVRAMKLADECGNLKKALDKAALELGRQAIVKAKR